MDDPNVNWKIVEIIQEYWEHNDPDGPDLIEIGSCRLHVLHGAYGTVQKAIDWNLDKLLEAVYSIFRFSPGRRKDCLKIDRESWIKKCSILISTKALWSGQRLLENGKALKRTVKLFLTLKDVSLI